MNVTSLTPTHGKPCMKNYTPILRTQIDNLDDGDEIDSINSGSALKVDDSCDQ